MITYYGSQKERKERRKGWSAQNAFNVCVTSYNLAIQESVNYSGFLVVTHEWTITYGP